MIQKSQLSLSIICILLKMYNASIMFFRNAFLVDITSEKIGRVLKLDSIESSKLWKGMDAVIFNSWHWWLHTGRKQPWDFIEDGNNTYKDMDRLVAYRKALNTWARWIDSNVDPTKTQVFFQGVSPDHAGKLSHSHTFKKFYNKGIIVFLSNGHPPSDISFSLSTSGVGPNCGGQTEPLPKYRRGQHPAELVLEKVLRTMSTPVHLLNVTGLSQLRIDGHPSVYGHGGHGDMDCSHWCLAGVPDTWNQLLYAAIIQN
ncbi:hypothetical protein RJ639_028497 [Escallonia herrerae]|uniref:Trichome birefringence-like C-terminal domain-containing protein n=1 Tax=Escallonia herrerae TaxID=1293975 RepID=A0AA89BPE0_9ASTE|nr:hypothetical protein RJ639_028497 [Escallonia herrerae]